MGKISDKLAKNPNEMLEFDHNGQIKDLLIDLNIDSRFKSGLEGERTQAVTYGEHPTHFILIVLWSGHVDRTQNGYYAWCLPKRKFTLEQFMELAKRVLNPLDARMLGAEPFWTRPGNPTN